MFSISSKFLNLLINSSKLPSFLIFFTYLSLADLEGKFFLISSDVGKITFLFINSKILLVLFELGKYLETLLSSE